jgi:hypothetical protein
VTQKQLHPKYGSNLTLISLLNRVDLPSVAAIAGYFADYATGNKVGVSGYATFVEDLKMAAPAVFLFTLW